jgi:hypothetical protein
MAFACSLSVAAAKTTQVVPSHHLLVSRLTVCCAHCLLCCFLLLCLLRVLRHSAAVHLTGNNYGELAEFWAPRLYSAHCYVRFSTCSCTCWPRPVNLSYLEHRTVPHVIVGCCCSNSNITLPHGVAGSHSCQVSLQRSQRPEGAARSTTASVTVLTAKS